MAASNNILTTSKGSTNPMLPSIEHLFTNSRYRYHKRLIAHCYRKPILSYEVIRESKTQNTASMEKMVRFKGGFGNSPT